MAARNNIPMSDIHVFKHYAMATQFQVRIAGQDQNYGAQIAEEAFSLANRLESLLSRFRANSEISQIAELVPGETLPLSEPVFACLDLAQRMEVATNGAFSATAAALKTQPEKPRWSLLRDRFAIQCDLGTLEFDLGAVGKGFALDRMAEMCREWDCASFMLVAGGSSILAGDAPPGTPGWSCGLGDDNSPERYWLKNVSLSGSGLAVQGAHIIDPRTGAPAALRSRVWALADTAAESDALSTACMILPETEICEIVCSHDRWLAFLSEGEQWRPIGLRPLPECDRQ
jgi:thiamine biosynthesis lipoprotein